MYLMSKKLVCRKMEDIKSLLLFLSVYLWDTSSHSPLILCCPFWFCPGIPSPFSRCDATRCDATPERIRFRTPNTLWFLRSLFTDFIIPSVFILLALFPLTSLFLQSVGSRTFILRWEYVTRGRAKRQTSNQGAWRDGSLWADEEQKGGKIFLNLLPNLSASIRSKWFSLCPSFIIDKDSFLKKIRTNSYNMIGNMKRVEKYVCLYFLNNEF